MADSSSSQKVVGGPRVNFKRALVQSVHGAAAAPTVRRPLGGLGQVKKSKGS